VAPSLWCLLSVGDGLSGESHEDASWSVSNQHSDHVARLRTASIRCSRVDDVYLAPATHHNKLHFWGVNRDGEIPREQEVNRHCLDWLYWLMLTASRQVLVHGLACGVASWCGNEERACAERRRAVKVHI